jgi:hypothetical protein
MSWVLTEIEMTYISPQVPSILLAICLGLNITVSLKFAPCRGNRCFNIVFQEELNMKESQLGDLKKNIELQQAETSKAESKLKTSLEEIEKIKAGFDAERTAWETDKAALQRKAEDAEAKLKPVTEELAGLKQHISQMSAAIFGKIPMHLIIYLTFP